MQTDRFNPDYERLVCIESRMTKKPKQELLDQLIKQEDFNNQNNQHIPNQANSLRRSDDLRCSQNSENNSPHKIYPSRNPSPSGSLKNKSIKPTAPKKKTPSKETLRTPPVKKKLGDKKITEYMENKKKSLKLKKQVQKQGEYSIQDSPLMRNLQKSPNSLQNKEELLQLVQNQDKQIKELKNQITIQNNLNEELRMANNASMEKQLKTYEVIKQLVIENESLKRTQLRHQLAQTKIRLGEYVIQREKTQLHEVWADGYEIKNLKDQIKQLEQQKLELENKRKNLKPKGDDLSELNKNNLALKITLIEKEEKVLHENLDRLETEKSLFIKQVKRAYEEDHARFSKAGQWPIIGERYQVLSLLGKGGFSEVYKAYDLVDLREVACKIHQLNPSWSDHSKQNYIKHAIRENRVHKELNHPNIVRLFDSVEIDKSSFCTVLELCDGPDLSYYLKKYKQFPEKEAKIILMQILSALKYLNTHRNKVIHYDLKPQNILFHQNEVKISDFGLCKVIEDDISRMELTSQGVGTYWYLPPECFHTGDQPPNISSKVDVWSIGVIFYEMLFGVKPFGHGLTQEKILKDQVILKAENVAFPLKPQISLDCKDFIRKCLEYHQSERMDAIKACEHAYITKKTV